MNKCEPTFKSVKMYDSEVNIFMHCWNKKLSYQLIITSISFSEVSVSATDEAKGDAACAEIGRTSIGTNTPENGGEFIRTCRHMGMAQSSPLCEICTLVSFFYSFIIYFKETMNIYRYI